MLDCFVSRAREGEAPRLLTPFARVVLLACASLTVASGTLLAPALPVIRDALRETPAGGSGSRLFVTLPALAIALSAPVTGRLIARVGARRMLVGSLALYAVAGATGLVAERLALLLAGRLVIGLAAAGLMTASTILAALALEDDAARSRFFAQQTSVMSLTGVMATVLGGHLSSWHWRAPFAAYLLAAPLGLLALNIGPAASVLSPRSRDTAAGSRGEWRCAPIYALTMVAMAFVFMVPLQVPFLFAPARPTMAGVAVATASLFAAASAALSARIRSSSPPLARIGASFVVMGAGYLVIGGREGVTTMFVGLAVAGVGTGWILPNMIRWLVDSTSEASRGASIGLLTSAIYGGQFVSPYLARLLGAGSLARGFTVAGVTLIALGLALAGVVAARKQTYRTP